MKMTQNKDTRDWTKDGVPKEPGDFIADSGITDVVKNLDSPTPGKLLQLFFTDAVLEDIVQGEIRHHISNVSTNIPNERRQYGNLYFLDTELANQLRSAGPQNRAELNREIVDLISNYLYNHNPFAQAYRFLKDVYQQQQQSNRHPTLELYINNNRARDINFRQYGAVQANEIAAVFISEDGRPPLDRCLHVYCRDNDQTIHKLPYLSVNCDAMTYPLLHPRREAGWQSRTPHQNRRGYISLLEYYSFRIAVRPNTFNQFVMAGKLTQQYIVDAYVKIEQSRLQFITENQPRIRQEIFQGLINYLDSRQLDVHYQSGNIFILPSTFIGSPRAFRQNYLDAMSIVTKHGKPDIFLTFTCNPAWPEIRNNLDANQYSSNRPDFVSRVFKSKLKELIEDIDKRHIMGVCVAYVYVIEFQKRGLPHAHMLIWLEESDKILDPAAIDRLISAEFPDPIAHANLYELVKVHMLHGPCTSARCLDEEGHCSKQFPKSLREDTLYNPSGYPLYKRRPIETPIHIGRRTVDTGWVVPYNAYLLEKYEAHINVEACSSMKSDLIELKLSYEPEADGQSTTIQEPMYNEIQMFLDVRYVSAPEAMWRIYTFEMHDVSHAIIKLSVHLPNMQQVYFNTNSTIPDVVERAATQHTTLTGWFALNTQDEEARQYTYVQIPYNYVWKITQTRIWVKRQRHFNRIIPRLYFVHPREGERFYLRQLLLHKTGCRSFEDIRTVHGRTYETFRDAAIAMNLLTDDSIWFTTLQEAIHVQLPRALRRMFSQMLLFCEIENPLALWKQFKYHLSEDYIRRLNDNDLAYNYALAYINRYLALQGKSNRDFELPLPTEPVEHLIKDEYDYDQAEEQEIANRNIPLLNQEQRRIFTDILLAVNENERVSHRLFFINGIGGAGKTFLLNTLLAYLL
ncbi:unnamed protein product [Acanthoscelides obtectus]|uniref:ATP-dependent DNA helicase n=1 Tax=Acanthoscelides obtectus TaxID=200917 RepID=A0A9P0PG36_ACAOB|nr:unnamed protein product [Acanthoscelides obtectus]CAK1641661.1 hypothetical protein AOBTE_LOCUS12539 [Acanthoscelides obtectus]